MGRGTTHGKPLNIHRPGRLLSQPIAYMPRDRSRSSVSEDGAAEGGGGGRGCGALVGLVDQRIGVGHFLGAKS